MIFEVLHENNAPAARSGLEALNLRANAEGLQVLGDQNLDLIRLAFPGCQANSAE